MSQIRDDLLSASNNGNFLEMVDQIYLKQRDDRHSIGKEIAILHNEGSIDAIAEFRRLLKKTEDMKFFTILHVFEHALPELDASVAPVMDCVQYLSAEARNAGTVPLSFIKYCEANPNRPREVLQIATGSGGEWLDFIPSAIIAGSNIDLSEYLGKAIELSSHKNIDIQIQAILSLRRIDYKSNKKYLTNAFRTLEKIAQTKYDDRLYSAILRSAFPLFKIENNFENNIAKLCNTILIKKGKQTLYEASEIVAFDTSSIPENILDILLDALKDLESENIDTVNNIDSGLSKLLKTKYAEKTITFIEYLLVKNSTTLTIKKFNSFTRELYRGDIDFLNKLVTRWLLSTKIILCKSVADILSKNQGNEIILVADTDQFAGQPDGIRPFVARKAIGWLFHKPISTTNFIISLMDTSNDDENIQIADLLFNPLLISYSGKVKQYVESILSEQSENTQKILTDALAKLEVYHDDLKAAQNIPELLPSISHRETYYRSYTQKMNKLTKKVDEKSFLSSLFSKSIILYGNKSINYIDSHNGKKNRMEIPFHTYKQTLEFPSLEFLDPQGLNEMLYNFKLERYDL